MPLKQHKVYAMSFWNLAHEIETDFSSSVT